MTDSEVRKLDIESRELVGTFATHRAAADSVKHTYPSATRQGIQAVVSGERDTMYGYLWEHADEQRRRATDDKRVAKRLKLKRKRVVVENLQTGGLSEPFKTGAEAAKSIGVAPIQVSRALTGRRKSRMFESGGTMYVVKYAVH